MASCPKRYKIAGLLTLAEIKAARTRLGLTQVEMARQLGVGDTSYTRWENGLSILPDGRRAVAAQLGLFT